MKMFEHHHQRPADDEDHGHLLGQGGHLTGQQAVLLILAMFHIPGQGFIQHPVHQHTDDHHVGHIQAAGNQLEQLLVQRQAAEAQIDAGKGDQQRNGRGDPFQNPVIQIGTGKGGQPSHPVPEEIGYRLGEQPETGNHQRCQQQVFGPERRGAVAGAGDKQGYQQGQ